VNSIVYDREKEASRGIANNSVPAAEQDSDVVIPVKKHQVLFANNNEERINELEEFTPGKDETPVGSRAETGQLHGAEN